MTLKTEDVEQYTEKPTENKGNFLENINKDLRVFSTTINKYPLVSLFFIFAVILLFVFPYVQVHLHEINNVTKEAELENQYRATLAQILGSVAIGIGLYYTWRRIGIAEKELQATQDNLKVTQEIADNNLKVSKEGQITERFTRAVDQLGNPAMEIRLGGIYALERISKESEDDYWPIMEILTAYVRKNSCIGVGDNNKVIHISMDIQANESTTSEVPEVRKVSLDIQAIITVLGKRKHSFKDGEDKRLNLVMVYLEGADLSGANLEGADLRKTHLEGADLSGAHLEGADLSGAHLEGAAFCEASLRRTFISESKLKEAGLKGTHLERAKLSGAHLEKSRLIGAHLEKADLREAHLEKSWLNGAHLEGANLRGAHLEGANLRGAHLERADLSGANLERADLNGANLERADLKGANLEMARLIGANLKEAEFFKTNLHGTNLQGANLEKAKHLTYDQVSKVRTLLNAKLDERDEKVLREEYPFLFVKLDFHGKSTTSTLSNIRKR